MTERNWRHGGDSHESALAAALSAGRRRRNRHDAISFAGGDVRGKLPGPSRQGRLRLHGQDDDLWRARRGLARLRRLAAKQGPQARRPRRHHDAECAAVSGGDCRHPARRLHGGERQSAVHAARAGTPAQRCRRRGHRGAGKFRACSARRAAAHQGETRGDRQHGRHAGRAEGHDCQFGGATREENGPGLFIAGRDRRSTMRLPPEKN